MGERRSSRVWWGNLAEEGHLEKLSVEWEDNTKMGGK
jgi:hypothetical protein